MAAQDAELKLKVSLDLGFFRQQLAGLGQAAAGYSMPVQVKFDRRAVQNELNALGANIRKRDYRLTIQTNLKAEIDQARKLAQAFADLEKGAFTPAQPRQRGSFTKSAFRGMDIADVKKLYKEAANAGLLSYDETIAKNRRKTEDALYGLGKDSIAGLLNGLKSDNEKIKTAAKNLGKDLIASVKAVLGIASPSKEFKKIGEDSGEGLEQGLKIGFGEAGDVGVREIEKLFQRLQKEAKAGSALLQAIMAGAMSGVMQLPVRQRGAGGSIGPMIRQQRAQVRAERQAQAGGMSALMMGMMGGVIPMGGTPRGAGGSISAMIRQQRTAVQAQRQAQAGSLSALMIAMMSGVVPMGGKPRGAGGSIKELIQQERAKVREQNRPLRIESLIAALSSARGNLSPAAGVNQRLATGGAVNPGVLSSGYIGRSALSPKFVNYPAGMPPAYATGFIEPTAFGNLAAGTTGRYGMGGAAAFPSSPMMRGGIGAGGGSFLPMDAGKSVSKFDQLIAGLTERIKGAAGTVRSVLMPTFGDMRRQAIEMNRSIAVQLNAEGTPFYGRYMTPRGNIGMYDFPTSGMMGVGVGAGGGSFVPPGGPPNQPPGGGGGRGGFGGMGGGQFRNLMGLGPSASPIDFSLFQQSRLPLSGAVRELGEEFGFAIKQVLLFGTAYKALAFLTNLPGEAFEAAKALANYRNQLDAVTSESGTFERSFAFVDNLAERFNVPLESARQGFVKLYASMEPAGFGPGQIENLFEGISKATAAFGLSADKVDRVNYAFAQMASKGQIMSEELKGQLGDVLPGALALFAEAAQMSIPEFSQAMEDGAFKGQAMQQVLDNVAVLMNNKFGPAAQNASKTLQGALNQIQNNLKLMYESMSPVVNQLAAIFGPQINSLIKDVTSAVEALNGSFAAGSDVIGTLSPRAEAFYLTLQQIGPSVTAAAQNIGNFASSLQIFISPLLTATKGVLDFISLPVLARVGLYAAIIASLNAAFQLLARAGIVQATIAMVRFLATLNIAQINVYIAGLQTVVAVLKGMVTAASLARVAVIGLKVALGGIVIGAVLVGLDILAQKVLNIGNAADSSKKSVREFAQELDQIAGSADVENATKAYMDANTELAKARKENQKALDELQEAKLRQATTLPGEPGGGIVDIANAEAKANQAYAKVIAATTKLRQTRQTRDTAVRRQEEERNRTQQQLKPIDLSAGEETKNKAAAQSLESLESLRDQLAKARMEGDMERAKILFEYQKRLDERRFELQESGANDIQKAGIKLAKDLFDIRMRFEQAVFEAGAAVTREAGSVAPGNRPPKAPKGQGPYGPITQFGAGANANLRIGQQVGGADMQRPVSGSERRDLVAAEKTEQTVRTESLRLTYELKKASEDYVQVIRQNFDTIFPVAQMQLQNQLLVARQQLELQAVPKEAIDAHLAIAEARAKGKAMQEELDKKLAQSIATIEKYSAQQEEGIQLTKQQTYELKEAEAFMEAYGQTVGEVAEKVKGFTIAQLESAIATMKQADALKAMEEVSGRINDAVTGVTDTYKSLFKEIAMGEDSVEALKKAQQALADQFLTMVFDMAMKPVEESMKNSLSKIFGVPNEEEKRKESINKMQAQLDELKASRELQKKIQEDTNAIRNGTGGGGAVAPAVGQLPAVNGGMFSSDYASGNVVTLPDIGSLTESANAYSEQLGKVDASVWDSTMSLGAAGEEMGANGAAGKTWQQSLSGIVGGLGMAAGSIMGIMAGINQIKEGGTSNVLGGIGMIASMAGSLLGGFGGMFGGGSAGQFGTSSSFNGTADALGAAPFAPKLGAVFANGGIAKGGFRAFANGGVVGGPTLGLMGEGKYNEAVVPLPDGRSIPVQLGGRSARDLMGGGAPGMPQAPSLSMKFETTKINGVEYVSREQLEQAMAETRRASIAGGAQRGMSMTLDRIKQSPSTRSSIGIR